MASASVSPGINDLPKVKLELSAHDASCDIYLFGATVTSWVKQGTEKIFVSENAIFNGIKAIRGGIPVVFPQFGQPSKEMPQHGFARTSNWDIVSLETINEETVRARLTLSQSDKTLELWPFSFRLLYEVVLTPSKLTTSLLVTNTDSRAFECHTLLHTYLQIHDINSLQVRGFANKSFVDKMSNGDTFVDDREVATIDKETDRVYLGTADENFGVIEATFCDPTLGAPTQSTTIITPTATIDGRPAACDVVFWNPWTDKARSLADLGEAAFPQFVCIEPGTVNNWVPLQPEKTLMLQQILE